LRREGVAQVRSSFQVMVKDVDAFVGIMPIDVDSA
jgi:hypothetical protein